jgi:hypothetical protein
VDISSIEPDNVSRSICRSGQSVCIGIFLLSVLGKCYLPFDEVMDFGQAVSKGMCLIFLGVIYSDIWFQVNFGVQSIVGKER